MENFWKIATLHLLWLDQVSTQVWSPWSGLHSGLINFDQVSVQVWSGPHSGQINYWSGLWSSVISPAEQALDQSESSLVNFKMSDFNTLVSVPPPSWPIRRFVSKFFEHFSAIWLVASAQLCFRSGSSPRRFWLDLNVLYQPAKLTETA